jgi:hypothetical protein
MNSFSHFAFSAVQRDFRIIFVSSSKEVLKMESTTADKGLNGQKNSEMQGSPHLQKIGRLDYSLREQKQNVKNCLPIF